MARRHCVALRYNYFRALRLVYSLIFDSDILTVGGPFRWARPEHTSSTQRRRLLIRRGISIRSGISKRACKKGQAADRSCLISAPAGTHPREPAWCPGGPWASDPPANPCVTICTCRQVGARLKHSRSQMRKGEEGGEKRKSESAGLKGRRRAQATSQAHEQAK